MRALYKAIPVIDGFYYVMRKHVIPAGHRKHFVDGFRGEPFTGRSIHPIYGGQSDSLFYYERGQQARKDVDSGKLTLMPAARVTSDVYYEIVDPYAPKKARIPLTDEQRRQKAEAKAAANIYRDLPKIIIVLGVNDHGPCEGGASAICPHCGAEGRYVYIFKCDDGTTRGAMRGCIQKFPRHAFADESQRILDKEADYKTRGWSLPSWDIAIQSAINEFAEGQISEQDAQTRIRSAQESRRGWKDRRNRRVA